MNHCRRCLLVIASVLVLAGCTMQFTPGDAKPSVFTPYPSGAASGAGDGMRGGSGTPP